MITESRNANGTEFNEKPRTYFETFSMSAVRSPSMGTLQQVVDKGSSSKRVLIIYTGGTLGMKPREDDGALVPSTGFLAELLMDQNEFRQKDKLPSLEILEWDPLLDSSDILPSDWGRLAKQIEEHYLDYDGFVVIHGTDTLAYTASALSFMLEHLGKPVVFTGSQIPMVAIYSDAKRNLLASILIACQVQIPEVLVCFGNHLYRANRVTKLDNWGQDAFASPNYPAIADLGIEMHVRLDMALMPARFRFKCHTELFTKIFVLHLVPGFDDGILTSYAQVPSEPRGLVLLLYGAGNAPNRRKGLLESLRAAKANNVEIVAASQCRFGAVDMTAYGTGRALLDMGIINGKDMTVEACVTKLAFLMGRGLSGSALKIEMERDLRGEVSNKTHRVSYAFGSPKTMKPNDLIVEPVISKL